MADNSQLIEEISESIKAEAKRKEERSAKVEYIDFDNIEIEKTPLESQKSAVEDIFGKISSYEVVCIQSGYSATLSALNYKDILTITNATLSSYETRKTLFKTIYNKITNMSFCGSRKPSFEDWMKLTSYGDLETLLYGVYCATFQEKSSVSFDCPYCGKEINSTIDNASLIQVEGKKTELSEEIEEITTHSDSLENMSEYSLVSINGDNKKRNIRNVKLPKTGIIFSIKLPTMDDVLTILKNVDEAVLGKLAADKFNILLTTSAVYVKNKNDKYFPMVNKNDIIHMIDLLSVDDISILKTAVYDLLEYKHIFYQISKQQCPHCKKDIYNIPMNIEDLLFFQISEKQLI